MPRVAINKKKYLKTDLREWMEGKMNTLDKNQAYMGAALGISQQAFGNRLSEANFKNDQLYIIFKELEATDNDIIRLMRL